MPDGGTLTISRGGRDHDDGRGASADCATLPPGDYVRITHRRHRRRHGRGDARQGDRAVLHHQGSRQGDRTRLVHGAWTGRAIRRPAAHPQRAERAAPPSSCGCRGRPPRCRRPPMFRRPPRRLPSAVHGAHRRRRSAGDDRNLGDDRGSRPYGDRGAFRRGSARQTCGGRRGRRRDHRPCDAGDDRTAARAIHSGEVFRAADHPGDRLRGAAGGPSTLGMQRLAKPCTQYEIAMAIQSALGVQPPVRRRRAAVPPTRSRLHDQNRHRPPLRDSAAGGRIAAGHHRSR